MKTKASTRRKVGQRKENEKKKGPLRGGYVSLMVDIRWHALKSVDLQTAVEHINRGTATPNE